METTEKAIPAGSREFKLPSGKKAVIHKGKGRNAMEAMRICDGKTERYLPALMAQLVEIDGSYLVMEDFEDMDLQDFMALQGEFADQNFTLPQGT